MSTVVASNLQAAGGAGTAATLASINGGPLAGSRNRIINGDMRIDQRYAGTATANTINGYTVDRWAVNQSVTGKLIAQGSTAVVPTGFTHSLSVTSQSAYSLASGDYYLITQPVEGFNLSDLAWGTASARSVTLSFWVLSSLTGTFGGCLRNNAETLSYLFSYSISASNTWEFKTLTISGPTSGAWETGNSRGVQLHFSLGSGSSWAGSAGSWQNANLLSVTGATSVVGTNGATFFITGVQLEAGTVATPFERRSFGLELALCQRYYEIGQTWGVSYGSSGSAVQRALTLFSVNKRASPSVTASVLSGSAGYAGIVDLTVYSAWIAMSTSGAGQESRYGWTASAEL